MSKKKGRKQYIVGDKEKGADFTPEELELLAYKMAEWFRSDECDRQYEDPIKEAKDIIHQCLLGITADGRPWRNCPHDFEARIRTKSLYDMTTGKGRPSARLKHPDAVRAKDPAAEKAAQTVRTMNPISAGFDQDKYRKRVEQDILKEFPELDNPAHRPNVERLSLIYTQQKVIDHELTIGVPDSKKAEKLAQLSTLEQMAERTMKLLDIHPDSIRKQTQKQKQGTLGDLVATLDGDEDFKDREKIWALQAALQLWWCHEHPNGRGDGPNLEAWEIWHMTRTRPIDFTCKCGRTFELVEGFTPEELRDYLIRQGVLVTEPVIPHILDSQDLRGLDKWKPEPNTPASVGGHDPTQEEKAE